jgi:hypothetical protein
MEGEIVGSILNDVKHQLGLLPENTDFDQTIVIHINTTFSILTQLGVGPTTGFQITGADEEWDAFYDDPRLNTIQSYVYLKVRNYFDPPKIGGLIASMDRQIQELEYRMNVEVDY